MNRQVSVRCGKIESKCTQCAKCRRCFPVACTGDRWTSWGAGRLQAGRLKQRVSSKWNTSHERGSQANIAMVAGERAPAAACMQPARTGGRRLRAVQAAACSLLHRFAADSGSIQPSLGSRVGELLYEDRRRGSRTQGRRRVGACSGVAGRRSGGAHVRAHSGWRDAHVRSTQGRCPRPACVAAPICHASRGRHGTQTSSTCHAACRCRSAATNAPGTPLAVEGSHSARAPSSPHSTTPPHTAHLAAGVRGQTAVPGGAPAPGCPCLRRRRWRQQQACRPAPTAGRLGSRAPQPRPGCLGGRAGLGARLLMAAGPGGCCAAAGWAASAVPRCRPAAAACAAAPLLWSCRCHLLGHRCLRAASLCLVARLAAGPPGTVAAGRRGKAAASADAGQRRAAVAARACAAAMSVRGAGGAALAAALSRLAAVAAVAASPAAAAAHPGLSSLADAASAAAHLAAQAAEVKPLPILALVPSFGVEPRSTLLLFLEVVVRQCSMPGLVASWATPAPAAPQLPNLLPPAASLWHYLRAY